MSETDKTVVIVGQGYVGLPVAMRAAEVGYRVVGIDVDERRVASLASGVSYVGDVSDEQLQAVLQNGRYFPSLDYGNAEGFDVAVVTVPTPLKESLPDLSFIEQSAASLAPHLKPGAIAVLESTTYPGTTEELFAPLLEKGSGLRAGQDFSVGYSPERIDPGNRQYGFVDTPKIVSGIDQQSLERIEAFYATLVERTVRVSGTREAELAKLLENTFRHVNIALVNELAVFAHQLGISVWESIDAASTKPFGFMRFTPGPGVGGHCLPVDPSYLSWQVKRRLGRNFRFVELANDINDHMPDYVVERLISLLNTHGKAVKGSNILLLGLAYKRNTSDVRESPALKIVDILKSLGAQVSAVDPHVERYRWPEGVKAAELTPETLAEADACIVLTAHSSLPLELLSQYQVPVLDTQGVLSGDQVERL